MTKIPEWQEYCDLVEPDVNILKTVLEDTDRNEFHDHVALEAVKQKYQSIVHEPTVIEKTMTPQNQQDYKQYKSLWAEMIIKGDCVNILLTTQRVGILSGLLKHGHVKRPETWIKGTRSQQQALIHNDLYIDELLKDENPRIRLEIGYRHREYLPDLLKSGSVQNLMTRDLLNKVKPKPELVQTLLDALPPTIPNTYGSMEVKALELKVQEPEQSMSAIECTMTGLRFIPDITSTL